MEDSVYSTSMLNEKIQICEEMDEFREEILANLKSQKEMWVEKIQEIINQNGYTKTKLAELCGVSRVAVNKWVNGSVPRQRVAFIKIGLAAHYNIDEMNTFLVRYGRYSELYAKNLEDSVCIFLLNSTKYEHSYLNYKMILDSIKMGLNDCKNERVELYETTNALNNLMDIENEDELRDFIYKNIGTYKSQYNKLYSYINMFLLANKYCEIDNKVISTNFLANGQQWTSSLRHCVSAINQKKWYPVRDKLISLGLHLNMDTDQINEMLTLAHMETLCAKNPFESAIIYAVENAKLEDLIFCDGTDSLCIYVKNIMNQLNIKDAGLILEEFPSEE